MIKNFTDLEVWKESHKLTLLVYRITKEFPKEEMFGLISQIRRAVISIESNIAEGFARFHYKDRLNFYFQARGSISELESQLITSKDLGYINEKDFQDIFSQAEKSGKILSGLIRSTENLSDKK
jgi:four helix bundle protein